MRIAVAIEIDGEFTGLAFEQFRRGVVLLKINEHLILASSEWRIVCERAEPLFATHYSHFYMIANSILRRSVTSIALG